MRVQVTQDHIDNGCRGLMGSCPIALAVRELTGANNVLVLDCGVIADGRDSGIPREAREFVRRFDNGEKVQPFDFEIDLVPRTVITTEAQRLRIEPDAHDNDPQGP